MITIQISKKYLLKYIKTVITLFVLLGFKCIASQAAIISTDKIIISGIIKDEAGKPLEKANVLLDSTKIAITDKDGRFSFELPAITPVSHNIYFNADGYVTIVRSYYPAMLSTNYDIILRTQIGYVKTTNVEHVQAIKKDSVRAITVQQLPVIKKDSIQSNAIAIEELDFPSVIFKLDATALSGSNKAFLDIISEKLKNSPAIKIDIKAYTFKRYSSQLIAQKRITNIINYLLNKGISAERLNKVIAPEAGDLNTIDFVNSKGK